MIEENMSGTCSRVASLRRFGPHLLWAKTAEGNQRQWLPP